MMTTGVATSESSKKPQTQTHAADGVCLASLKEQLQGAMINNDFDQVPRLSKLCELTAALGTMKESMQKAIAQNQFREVAALAQLCEQHREEIAQLSSSSTSSHANTVDKKNAMLEESTQSSSPGIPKDIITQVTVPTNMTPRVTSRTDALDESSIDISEVMDEETTVELTEDEKKGNSTSTGITSAGNTTTTTTSKQPNKPKMNLRNILKKHEKKAPPPPPPAPAVDFFGSMGSIPFLKPQEDKKNSSKTGVRRKKKGSTPKTNGKTLSEEPVVVDSDAEYMASKKEKKPEITMTATHTEADIELWKTMNNNDRLQTETIQNRPAQMLPLMPSPRKSKQSPVKFSEQGERAFSRPDEWLNSNMKSPESSYTVKEGPTRKPTIDLPLVGGEKANDVAVVKPKGKPLPGTSWHSTTSTGSSQPKTLPKTSWHSTSGNSKPKTLPKTSWHSTTGNSKPKMLPRTSSHSTASWGSLPQTVEENTAVPSQVTTTAVDDASDSAAIGSIKNRVNMFSGK